MPTVSSIKRIVDTARKHQPNVLDVDTTARAKWTYQRGKMSKVQMRGDGRFPEVDTAIKCNLRPVDPGLWDPAAIRLAAFRANAPEFQWRSTRLGCPDSGKAPAPPRPGSHTRCLGAPLRAQGARRQRDKKADKIILDNIFLLSTQLLLLLKHWFHPSVRSSFAYCFWYLYERTPFCAPHSPDSSPPQHDLTSSGAPDNPPSPSSYWWMAATFAALGLASSNT